MSAARLRCDSTGAVAKASLKVAFKLQAYDPKPRDLPVASVNVP
jgi:hypothetical protein